MRPRGNALPPCQQRAGAPLCGTRSQTNAVAPEAGACVAWNSSPVLLCHPRAPARTRASHVCMASQKDIVFLPLDFLPEPSQMSQDTKRNGERKVS